jgi:SAM-dependent methyltransferase
MATPESAKETYDRYAAVYDETNAQNNYEMWVGEVLLPELEKYGLRKDWVLDVGCGTGRAFDPLLDRGWRVVGCDVSTGMLAEAQRKFDGVRLFEADARNLPVVSPDEGEPSGGAFSLILLLNDVVNYLTEDGDLERVFAGIEQNLSRRQGLVVFDANTVALFRHDFASGLTQRMEERGLEWHGLTDDAQSGGIFEARLSGQGVEPHVHRQRHWSTEQVKESLEASGLRCVAALGQREEGERILLSEPPDEERDAKVIYIAAHRSQE